MRDKFVTITVNFQQFMCKTGVLILLMSYTMSQFNKRVTINE